MCTSTCFPSEYSKLESSNINRRFQPGDKSVYTVGNQSHPFLLVPIATVVTMNEGMSSFHSVSIATVLGCQWMSKCQKNSLAY